MRPETVDRVAAKCIRAGPVARVNREPPIVQIPKRYRRLAPALASLLLAGLFAVPAGAQSTEEKLEAAKKALAKVEAEAAAATAEYEEARGRYILTMEKMSDVKGRIAKARKRVAKMRGRLGLRAREVYQQGATSSLELLLEADSFSEFSDRVVFLDQLAQKDVDLVLQLNVVREELGRRRADLRSLARQQTAAVTELRAMRKKVYEKLAEAQALRDKLGDKLAAERAAARALAASGIGTVQGEALQACPVPGASYVDSWGAPRSGGRTHKGVDMMAPSGTPVYAAQTGTVSHTSSDLGGISAYVNGSDTTFYAHLQGYSSVGSGQHVEAGTLIGYVGDTGNARGTPHLHFEYWPGGGAPINPYPYVRAVC
jgi:murein DD-endopeptidase MepM/ murein hydrolase activator NlpD